MNLEEVLILLIMAGIVVGAVLLLRKSRRSFHEGVRKAVRDGVSEAQQAGIQSTRTPKDSE
ncbi:hypothetical protein [Occultella kanbiaonis]|uniref:hypothetical protein n=1 Tax=Occultella kanbiaonis TaxID=2675754 RepID=UPI0013D302A4|nr:hypothetical protein [Occultella kanbiaonis]